MDIFSVFTLCGGLAFFLYGMTVMSKSLEKMAGGKLERMLKRMTSSPFKSLLLGAGITIAIQSSSAMTVMLVGLVNSGVMELRQTIGIIMGSNIGTTLTAWILSLTGIESENVFVNLLKPENFSPLIALAGILLIMGSKRQRRRDVGRIMMGFAILMYGMELMSGAVSPLAEMPQFAGLLTAFENPLLGVLVGAVFTGIIQSSAASVAILQALAMTGSITYGMAIPIIMGQNIGTCVTALISSIGVNRNAKRVAVVHISFNVIGTAVHQLGYQYFYIVLWALWPVLASRGSVPTGWVVGWGLLCIQLGQFVGSVAAAIALTFVQSDLGLAMVSAGVIFAILIIALFAMGSGSANTGWGFVKPMEEADAASDFEKAGTRLARRCRLSPREIEVFFLLAKGRNRAYIREELVIGDETVKSHIKSIYRKADVHSQQELIDLLERESSADEPRGRG